MRVAPPLPAAPLREVPPVRGASVHHESPGPRAREGAGDSPRFPTPAELYARGASARPGASDLSGLSPRLRAKIAKDIERDEQPSPALPIAIGLMTIAALVIGLLVWQRVHHAHDATVRASATADSIARSAAQREPPLGAAALTHSESLRVARRAHADSLRRRPVMGSAPVTATPRPVETKAQEKAHEKAPAPAVDAAPASDSAGADRSSVASNVAAAKPTATRAARTDSLVFCVGVSSFIERTQAEVERDRVAVLTGLPGRVVPYRDGANTMYRVVVGTYPSNGAAEKAATSLMAQYGLAEAQPLLLDRIKPSR
jgi:cell division protein FtsN